MSDTFNAHDNSALALGRFRVTETTLNSRRNQTLPKRIIGEFLKGPIPLDWLRVAARLRGKALNIGLAAWFEAGRRKSKKIKLTTDILERFAVNRKAKYRGLDVLESAGLITIIKGGPGKNPVIEIQDCSADNSRPKKN